MPISRKEFMEGIDMLRRVGIKYPLKEERAIYLNRVELCEPRDWIAACQKILDSKEPIEENPTPNELYFMTRKIAHERAEELEQANKNREITEENSPI